MTVPKPSRDIEALLEIMAALRTPGTGCPWDLAQDFSTIAPFTIEEAYEVADAIARDDYADLAEELGDLLLQVVFHAQMAEEARRFNFGDVVYEITKKLLRRHPHVFGDAIGTDPEVVKGMWATIKAEEKAEKAQLRAANGQVEERAESALDGIPLAFPALTRALKLQEKAGRVGFDWGAVPPVLAKIKEEIGEMEAEIAAGDHAAAASEIGDVLFALVNLARHLDVDPEAALRQTNDKFTRRFHGIEAVLAQSGRTPAQSNLAEMDALWNAIKRAEKKAP